MAVIKNYDVHTIETTSNNRLIVPKFAFGSNMLTNAGFETGGGSPFGTWQSGTGGTSSVNDDTVVFNSGAHSCRFDIDGSGNFASVQQYPGIVAGNYYVYRAMNRHNKGTTVATAQITCGTTTAITLGCSVPDLTWTQVNGLVQAGSDNVTLGIFRPASQVTGASYWTDDTELYAVDSKVGTSTEGSLLFDTTSGKLFVVTETDGSGFKHIEKVTSS